jgi:hypothetical protein
MTNEPEVTLETDHLDEVIEAPPPAQPVVVIQYRSRGAPWYLVLPLLLLVPLGAVAVYHRVTSRGRRSIVLAPAQQEVSGKESQTKVAKEARPGPPGGEPLPSFPVALSGEMLLPLALNSQPVPPGSLPLAPSRVAKPELPVQTETASPKPADPSAPPPSAAAGKPAESLTPAKSVSPPAQPEPRSAVAVGFSLPRTRADDDNPFAELNIARNPPAGGDARPADPDTAGPRAAAEAPDDRPQPSKEELINDIQAEAAEKRAELNQLRNLKDHARDEIEAESQARTEEDRAAFHRELMDIIKSGSRKAGQEINDLCDKYGRNYDSELRNRVFKSLGKAKGRTTREKVKMLRQFGVPEPGILDYLANTMNFSMNSRNGPRNVDEVRVVAAKQLLQIKLAGDPEPGRGLQAQRGRGAGALAPSAVPGAAGRR